MDRLNPVVIPLGTFGLGWGGALAVLLAALSVFEWGCAPLDRSAPAEDFAFLREPLPGMDDRPESAMAGQQGASLQLTSDGVEYLRLGRLDEAMSKFQKAIALSSSNPYAYYYFAEVRFLRKEYHQSLPLLDRAGLLFAGQSAWLSKVHVLRGRNYEALLRFEDAGRQYEEALLADPGNREAAKAMRQLRDGLPGP